MKKISEAGGIFSNWKTRAPFEVRGSGLVLRWTLFVTRYLGQIQNETMDDGCALRFVRPSTSTNLDPGNEQS